MSKSIPVQFVVLHPDFALQLQKDRWFVGYLHKHGYFLCSKVETGEPYLCATIKPLPDFSSLGTIHAQIPHHGVLCIVDRFPEKTPGFGTPESSADKARD